MISDEKRIVSENRAESLFESLPLLFVIFSDSPSHAEAKTDFIGVKKKKNNKASISYNMWIADQ